MARILLVIGDAAEVLDTFYPLHRLQEEGYQVDVAHEGRAALELVRRRGHGLALLDYRMHCEGLSDEGAMKFLTEEAFERVVRESQLEYSR